MLRWLKTVVVSDEEKAPQEVSGGDQEGAVSKEALKMMSARVRSWRLHQRVDLSEAVTGQVLGGVAA